MVFFYGAMEGIWEEYRMWLALKSFGRTVSTTPL